MWKCTARKYDSNCCPVPHPWHCQPNPRFTQHCAGSTSAIKCTSEYITPSSASMWCNSFFKPGSLSACAIKCSPRIYDTNCCNFGTPPPSAATLGMIEGSTPFYSQLHFWRGMIEAPFYGQLHSDFFLCFPSQPSPQGPSHGWRYLSDGAPMHLQTDAIFEISK